MKTLIIASVVGGAASLGACAEPAPAPVAAVARAEGTCSASSPIDVNGDGWISGDEWNRFHTSSFGAWDTNRDGRVSRREFEACYRAGGFYLARNYQPEYWTNYWSAFDKNGDGYLTGDEYWSPETWARIDRNHNDRIDADEWVWWYGR